MTTTAVNGFLEAAIGYAAHDWPVVVVHGVKDGVCTCHKGRACPSPGKWPHIKNWVEEATTDEALIRRWWNQWPDANVGLAWGERVDIEGDGPEADSILSELFDGDVPVAPTYLSDRGKHRVFQLPDGLPKKPDGSSLAEIALGQLEIRCKGSQSVAPPSNHVSGKQYKWLPELSPEDVDPPTIPPEVVQRIVERYNALHKGGDGKPGSIRHALYEQPTVPKGTIGRDPAIHAEACAMWREQYQVHGNSCFESAETHHLVLTRLQGLNALKCRPSLPPDQVAAKCENARDFIMKKAAKEGLPEIDAGCNHLPTVTTQAWAAVRKANTPPRLFRYGGRLMRSETGDEGELVLKDVSLDRIRYEAADAAFWFKWHKPAKDEKAIKLEVSPPDKALRNMLATPDIDLPRLTRIVEAPVFAPDGTVQTEPGYHAASRTYYTPAKGLVVPEVAERPAQEDIDHAVDLLCHEMMGDFPFIGKAEKAHVMALTLQPFARDLIDGCTPLYLIEKPTPGTGATLLLSEIVFIATGRPLLAMTEGRDEDEWRKRLTAKLRTGASHVVIDNLRARLDSAALSAAITSGTWEDRILGLSETARIPVRCCWVATGNNPAVSSELARRTVRIRLDAKVDRPWLRTSFRHPDLHAWVQENRGRLIWATLTLIQAWFAAGRPVGGKKLGGFEAWSEVMGGTLDMAGVPGFLANIEEFYEVSDTEGTALRGLITAWWDKHKDAEVTIKVLWPLINQEGVTIDLGDGTERSQKTRFGKLIGAMRDRMFNIAASEDSDKQDESSRVNVPSGGEHLLVRVEAAGSQKNANLWKLGEVENEPGVNV